jgi:hypothetical protein
MGEYVHRVYRDSLQGYAGDPQQNVSNAGSPLLDNNLTVRNGINIAIAASYGKRVLGAGYKAVVGQIGNSRLESGIEVASKGLGYLTIGIASGAAAIYTVPLAIAADIGTQAIENLVARHNTDLENERKVAERGTTIQLGAGGYFG